MDLQQKSFQTEVCPTSDLRYMEAKLLIVAEFTISKFDCIAKKITGPRAKMNISSISEEILGSPQRGEPVLQLHLVKSYDRKKVRTIHT